MRVETGRDTESSTGHTRRSYPGKREVNPTQVDCLP